jgi:hypothetical protein
VNRLKARLLPLVLVLGVQSSLLVGLLCLGRVFSPPARLIPLDNLAAPGSSSRIGVRIHAGLCGFPGVAIGEREVLLVPADVSSPEREAEAARLAVTDSEGAAWFELEAPQVPGSHEFLVALKWPKGLEVVPPTARVILDVIPLRETLLLVQVPGAIQAVLLQDTVDRDGAGGLLQEVEELRDLGRYLHIVYFVEARWRNARNLRHRLEERKFPGAPIVGLGRGPDGVSPQGLIRSLDLSRWPGTHWAVVATADDARVLEALGVRVVILEPVPSPAIDDHRIFSAGSWAEVRRKIIRVIRSLDG